MYSVAAIRYFKIISTMDQTGKARSKSEVVLIYDNECPACRAFSTVVRVRKDVGTLLLIDARVDHKYLGDINSLGMDLDEGFVLKIENQYYHGADAMHVLALIGSRSGLFNRLNYRIFKNKRVSAVLYPALKYCRGLLLTILGKKKIRNLG